MSLTASVLSCVQLNRSEFDGVEDELRVQFEGYRPGMYVRLEVAAVPCELVTHFDPTYPLIVGGLTTGEENIGYVQVGTPSHCDLHSHQLIIDIGDGLTTRPYSSNDLVIIESRVTLESQLCLIAVYLHSMLNADY